MSDILIEAPNTKGFEPHPHIESNGFSESTDSIDLDAGRWIRGNFLNNIPQVLDIGDVINMYIVVDWAYGGIIAQSTAPLVTDVTKKLLVKLIFATYAVGSDEYPDNPPYAGTYVLTGWVQYQCGDIVQLEPDSVSGGVYCSLGYNTAHFLEVDGFEGASDATIPVKNSNVLTWSARGTVLPGVCTNATGTIGNTGIAFANHTHEVNSSGFYCSYAATAGSAGYASTSGSTTWWDGYKDASDIPHDGLTGTAASSAHDTHMDLRYILKTAAGIATQNACDSAMCIGDSGGIASISPDARTLYSHGGGAVLEWDESDLGRITASIMLRVTSTNTGTYNDETHSFVTRGGARIEQTLYVDDSIEIAWGDSAGLTLVTGGYSIMANANIQTDGVFTVGTHDGDTNLTGVFFVNAGMTATIGPYYIRGGIACDS